MKITTKQLKQLVREELQNLTTKTLTELEGEEVMAAIEDVPNAAQRIAEKVKTEIEKMAEPSGLDPLVLAQAVAALLTTD